MPRCIRVGRRGAKRFSTICRRADNKIAFFEYAYDVDGKCISQTTAEGKESYTYDADGQLTSVTYPDGSSESFIYDAVGNRISRTGGSPVQNEMYTVNNLNQYTEIVNAQAARSTMEYDLDGNMTRKGDTRYWYDTLNRLIAVTNEAENIRWSCEYDVFGNRISITDKGTTTERLFVRGSLPSVAAEYQGNTLTKSHVLVGAVRIADISRTGSSPIQDLTTRYYHGDMLGSARLITDGTGATKGSRSFKVFGETRISTGETTDAGYVGTLGVETDSNGLLFMRNRYYDACIGRFMHKDKLGIQSLDFNFYRYCVNDPLLRIDPSGNSFILVAACIGSGLVSVGYGWSLYNEEMHYGRNKFNDISDWTTGPWCPTGWEELSPEKSEWHTMGEEGKGNRKFVSCDGHREVVINPTFYVRLDGELFSRRNAA